MGYRYCLACENWVLLKARAQRESYREHYHPECTDYWLPAEILASGGGLDGSAVKPMLNGRWRLGWLINHSGYSDHDVFGHEAGGWSHYHWRAYRTPDNKYLDLPTRAAAVTMASEIGLDDLPAPDVACGASGY